jgi:hypothetical protein
MSAENISGPEDIKALMENVEKNALREIEIHKRRIILEDEIDKLLEERGQLEAEDRKLEKTIFKTKDSL